MSYHMLGGILLITLKKKGLGTPTKKLEALRKDLLDMNKRLIIVAGLPSTGKTKQAIDAGIHEVEGGYYDKLILVRPVVIPKAGLLPGNLNEKMQPYTRQTNIYCYELNKQKSLEEMIAEEKAEIILSLIHI